MTIVCLEHAPFEGPAMIADWAAERGHVLHRVPLYAGEMPPRPDAFDMAVIMGGPMNVYQHRDHPWLLREKAFLMQCIAAGKPLLGICLGAQLLADVLGGKVFQNVEKEIGWMPVRFLNRTGVFSDFPEAMDVLHWHGDTFSLPSGARLLAASDACVHQAFVYADRIVGLQFHLEMGELAVSDITEACAADLTPGPYVQSREELVAPRTDNAIRQRALFSLLDRLAASAAAPQAV